MELQYNDYSQNRGLESVPKGNFIIHGFVFTI